MEGVSLGAQIWSTPAILYVRVDLDVHIQLQPSNENSLMPGHQVEAGNLDRCQMVFFGAYRILALRSTNSLTWSSSLAFILLAVLIFSESYLKKLLVRIAARYALSRSRKGRATPPKLPALYATLAWCSLKTMSPKSCRTKLQLES